MSAICSHLRLKVLSDNFCWQKKTTRPCWVHHKHAESCTINDVAWTKCAPHRTNIVHVWNRIVRIEDSTKLLYFHFLPIVRVVGHTKGTCKTLRNATSKFTMDVHIHVIYFIPWFHIPSFSIHGLQFHPLLKTLALVIQEQFRAELLLIRFMPHRIRA